jgi:protein O-mannosyl-transferase
MDRPGRWILLIVFVTAISFAPALSFFFLSDDFTLIETARNSSVKALFSSETWVYYRPLLLLSYAVEHTLWKASPAGYHATNVFLHALNTVLVCFLARRLLGRSGRSWIFAGLLFGLTPIHASSVLWICGRTDLLCGTFYLISILTFLLHLEEGRPVLRWASIFSFIVALLCKEMAGSIPLVCLIWGTIFFRKEGNFKHSFAKALKASWVYFFGLALYFVFRYFLFGHFPVSPVHDAPPLGHLLTNIGRYGAGLIFPFDLEAVKPFFRPRPDLLLVGSLVGIGVLLALLRFVVARRPLVFACAWIGITLLPVLKFAGPWYLYIPSAGVAFGLGYLLAAFVSKGKVKRVHRWSVVAMIIGIHLFGLAQAEYNTRIASNMSDRSYQN